MECCNILELINEDVVQRLLIRRVLHDISSPLNTIMLGVDFMASGDESLSSCLKDSASKMASVIYFARLLMKTDNCGVPSKELEQSFDKLCSTKFQGIEEVPLLYAQLIVCVLYSIINASSKIKRIVCTVGDEGVCIQVSADNIFCSFVNNEATSRNIFEYIAQMLLKYMHRNIAVSESGGGFVISM